MATKGLLAGVGCGLLALVAVCTGGVVVGAGALYYSATRSATTLGTAAEPAAPGDAAPSAPPVEAAAPSDLQDAEALASGDGGSGGGADVTGAPAGGDGEQPEAVAPTTDGGPAAELPSRAGSGVDAPGSRPTAAAAPTRSSSRSTSTSRPSSAPEEPEPPKPTPAAAFDPNAPPSVGIPADEWDARENDLSGADEEVEDFATEAAGPAEEAEPSQGRRRKDR